MARLKFFLFLLASLLALLALTYASSVSATDVAVQQAVASGGSARLAAEAALAARRADLASGFVAALSAGAKSRPENAVQGFGALRTAALQVLPEGDRGSVVFVASSGDETRWARADAEPKALAAEDGMDGAVVLAAGVNGAVIEMQGAPYQFFSAALPTASGNMTFALGLPLITLDTAEAIAKRANLPAVGVVMGHKLLASAGAAKDVLTQVVGPNAPSKLILPGASGQLGPLGLPYLGAGDPPRAVVLREALEGTRLEIAAAISMKDAMTALAAAQERALFTALGLFVLGTFLLLTLRRPEDALPSAPARKASTAHVRLPPVTEPPKGAELFSEPAPPLPEVSADNFPFGPPPERNDFSAATPEPVSASAILPGSFSAADFSASPAEASAAQFPFDPPVDMGGPPRGGLLPEVPTAIGASASQVASMSRLDEEEESSATRVAQVPSELLLQSAEDGGMSAYPQETVILPQRTVAQIAPLSVAGEDEPHFQSVYREFVSTRERCGEVADGLTYERFVAKLLKNRDQLMQKYGCRTVRFQVYVKEGKAALKATPIRD
ncbi:MAG: MXAN_5187 family protein [Myxococcaceae bacterium]